MKIIKFIIENYRAISKIEFGLQYSINPIIGVNESGKTSVLKAILAFDKTRDKLNKGEHLEYQNKYSTRNTENSRITAVLKLDKIEFKDMIRHLKLKTNTEDYKYLSTLLDTENTFNLERNLITKEYILNDDILSDSIKIKLAKYLVKHLPYILYFDDFTDRVPTTINFPTTYKSDGKIPSSRYKEWQEIIEELFKRADTEGEEHNSLKEYLNILDEDRREGVLADIQDTLNEEIIEEWKRIKKAGKNMLGDDSETLEIDIKHEKGTSDFSFKVKDKAFKGKTRTFSISERSKGFQWFFNYMMKLKFNPNYKGKMENSIFLLDEPGSYLHSSAQSELLKELESVSNNNTIIYCTHSQYLLNPNVIKLGSIKIAEKDKSSISLETYGTYKGKKNKGALSPIYQALQLNFSNDYLGKLVITEGITDYCLFNMIQKHTDHINKDIKFIPGTGAKQLSTLISLAISFSDTYLVLLDNDKEGLNAKKQYIKEFSMQMENNIFIYGKGEIKFELENYLDGIKDELLNITKTTKVKDAIGVLFYDYEDKQSILINKIDFKILNSLIKRFNQL